MKAFIYPCLICGFRTIQVITDHNKMLELKEKKVPAYNAGTYVDDGVRLYNFALQLFGL